MNNYFFKTFIYNNLENPIVITTGHTLAKLKDPKNKFFSVDPETLKLVEIFLQHINDKFDFGFFDYEKSKMLF